MKKARKKIFSVIMAVMMAVSLINVNYVYANETTISDLNLNKNQIVVLYTNDVHGGISNNSQYSGSSTSLGFAGLAAIKEQAEKSAADVTLVDLGDALQGSVVASQSEGLDVLDIMNQVGYDYQVFGNHEFDYGVERTFTFMENSKAAYLGVNYIDLKTNTDITEPYAIKEYIVGDKTVKVGYVGVLTPENITKGSADMFQDDGNYIYSFYGDNIEKFYGAVQQAINEAKSEGADYIVGIGHLGDEGITEGWSSREIIGNTTGLNVFLDGHAHSVLKGDVLKDKNGDDVILSSTGTKLENIGALRITVNEDGTFSAETDLINTITDEEKELSSYKAIDSYVQEIQGKYQYLIKKVGTSDFGLYIYNPENGKRLIRSQETNMGDFITDAFRIGMDADVALSNGGNIRADIQSGDITYLDVLNVLPWSDVIVKIEVTGQQLIDCLEMGASLWPEECGGFIQTSGMTYDINTDIKSSVKVDEYGMFVSVEGEYRVQNVKVAGKPLQLDKKYTLAIDDCYYSEIYDGMTMFLGSKAIVGPDEGPIDDDLVVSYIESMGGKISDDYADINGQGRIRFITNSNKEEESTTPEESTSRTEITPETTTRAPEQSTIKKNAPAKAKIVKVTAKKKASKKVKLSIKKINDAKGYQVAIYKSKKDAKKNKKAVVKKVIKKVKVIVKSKKLKNKKKLYVRVRAYKLDTKGNKVYGKWSKQKKITVK
ncbi:MAG: bifunctional metallophosphatase/5'-nucleotidase [Eubacterium sp.]